MTPINPLYILPNLFTGGSVFLGILSMVYAINSKFEYSCWLILIALIFDGLDGRVARLTGTTSKFGVEFDSLADIVSFGVAPAILLYIYIGHDFGKFGIVISALFVILGAVRLARFNITTGNNDPNVFIGLPIPSAAVFVAIWVLMDLYYDLPKSFEAVLLVMAFIVSILMVSNIRYPSFKNFAKNGISLRSLIALMILIVVVFFLYTTISIALAMSIYILFGIIRACYYLIIHRIIPKM